ncbi:MAG: hypothetical protein WCW16_05525 [Candidatus Magasanikbacteria bacterium]
MANRFLALCAVVFLFVAGCASIQQRVVDDYHTALAEVGAEDEGFHLDGSLVLCVETEMLDTPSSVRARLELAMASVFSQIELHSIERWGCDADGCRADILQASSSDKLKAHLFNLSQWEDRLVVCGRGEAEKPTPTLPLDHPLYDVDVVPSEVIPGR